MKMLDKKSIALIAIIALMAGLGFMANGLYQQTVKDLAAAKQRIQEFETKLTETDSETPQSNQQTQEPSWTAPPSKSLKRALNLIASREKIVSGYDFNDEVGALLISDKIGSAQHRSHALWFFNQGKGTAHEGARHIKTIDTPYSEEVTLEKNGTTVIFSYQSGGSPYWITHHKDVYSEYGKLLLIYEEEPEQSKAMFRLYDDYHEFKIPVELVFRENSIHLGYIEMIGIRVADGLHAFASTKVKLPTNDYPVVQDIGYPTMRPSFAFQEYDREYSVVELRLPNGKSLLIDVRKQKVVKSKETFSHNDDCNSRKQSCSLLRKTPRRTETLIADVWSDPALFIYKEKGRLIEEFQRSERGNPIFKLLFVGEDLRTRGRFEFDLQSRRFIKL